MSHNNPAIIFQWLQMLECKWREWIRRWLWNSYKWWEDTRSQIFITIDNL